MISKLLENTSVFISSSVFNTLFPNVSSNMKLAVKLRINARTATTEISTKIFFKFNGAITQGLTALFLDALYASFQQLTGFIKTAIFHNVLYVRYPHFFVNTILVGDLDVDFLSFLYMNKSDPRFRLKIQVKS